MPADFQSLLLSHPVLTHPFLVDFEKGILTKDQVKAYFREQYFISRNFPSTFSAVYARIPDEYWKDKRKIIDLLQTEAWGSGEKEAHDTALHEICQFLLEDISNLDSENPKPFTQKYIEDRMKFYLTEDIQKVVAGVAYNELLFYHLSSKMLNGLKKIKGLEDCPTSYFEAHIRDEKSDFEVFNRLLSQLITTSSDIEEAKNGVQFILNLRQRFFDELYAEINPKRK